MKVDRPLKLSFVEGDKEGRVESPGDVDVDGKLECPVEGSDDSPEEGAWLKIYACWKATKRAVPNP